MTSPSGPATSHPHFPIIAGSPYACGRTLGQLHGPVLRERIAQTLATQRQNGIPDRVLEARIREFTDSVRKVAPDWLDEVKGMADTAGIEPEQILMLNCLPSDFYSPQTPASPPGNCTSFVHVGKTENRLFKIRDERSRVQSFHIQPAYNGVSCHLGRDIGNIGCAHALNRHGVAGANNTGSHTDLVSGRPTLNDCHTLRYFAENAACVEDIPRLYERLLEAGAASGAGEGRGAIYILADPQRGLILECVERDYVATFVDQGTRVVSNHFLSPNAQQWWSRLPNINTSRRQERMECLMAQPGFAVADAAAVFAMSRDRKHHPHCLCNDHAVHFWMTVSAQLHVIDRSDPGSSVNYACCGNTRQSVFLPVPLAEERTYRALADGSFYQAADALYRKHHCSRHFATIQRRFEAQVLAAGDFTSAARDAHQLLQHEAQTADSA